MLYNLLLVTHVVIPPNVIAVHGEVVNNELHSSNELDTVEEYGKSKESEESEEDTKPAQKQMKCMTHLSWSKYTIAV